MIRAGVLTGLLPAMACLCAVAALAAPPTNVKLSVAAPKSQIAGKPLMLTIDVHITPPYHIQTNPPKEGYIATVLTFGSVKEIRVGKIDYPKGTSIIMGGETMPVYKDVLTLKVPVTAAKPGKYVLPVALRFQACNDTQCYPPEIAATTVTLQVTGRH